MKLIVVGLDGAHWELIQPWIQEGSLPNIEKIVQSGVWGDMLSCFPPVTFPNWKCYSTGKNPGKIGIFWWENIDFEQGKIYHPFSRKFKNREIWDYIGETGRKVGVIGVPSTYPPKKVNGFMISGGPDAGEEGFTYPEKLEETIKEKYGFKLRPQTPLNLNKEKAAREIRNIIDAKFKVAKILAKEYHVDFLQVTSFEINTMHHSLWNDKKTKECWKTIDNHLQVFLEDGETNVMLVSDHGSNEIKTVFNINTWLEKKGYLQTHTTGIVASNILYNLGITQDLLSKMLHKLKLRRLVGKIPNNLVERIPMRSGAIKKKTDMINWEESKAVASGQGPVYLKAKDEEERNKLIEQLRNELEEVIDPITRKRVVEKVYSKKEVYSGEYLNEAPDLILDQAKGVYIPGGIGMRNVFSHTREWRAENKKWGLFAAYGPDIKSGEKIRNISILDLAPTILHMFNIPFPQDMDGRVLTEIFHEQTKIAQRKVRYREISRKGKIKDKVQGLKRLGRI